MGFSSNLMKIHSIKVSLKSWKEGDPILITLILMLDLDYEIQFLSDNIAARCTV